MTKAAETLKSIFDAERGLRLAEKALLATQQPELIATLSAAVAEAKALEDSAESRLRLERLADLCAQIPGPEMTDALIAILDNEWPAVRVQAAEALCDVAYERYAEVARGVERALEGSQFHALQELPWVLVELGEPSARKLIARFLESKSADVVASAVEALAELGDPASIKDLRKLEDDEREVEIDSEEGDETVTVGELVAEAIEDLGGDDEPATNARNK